MKVSVLAGTTALFLCGSSSAFHLAPGHSRHWGSRSTVALSAKKVSFKEDARRGLVSGINKVSLLLFLANSTLVLALSICLPFIYETCSPFHDSLVHKLIGRMMITYRLQMLYELHLDRK